MLNMTPKIKKIDASKNTAEAEVLILLLKDNGFNPLEPQRSSRLNVAYAGMYYCVENPDSKYNSVKR